MSRTRLLATTALVCVLHASHTYAAGSCTISATSVNFGSYNVFNASATDSTGTLTINCNGGAHNIVVTLSKGASATFNPRKMTKGAETLDYNLFRDAGRSNIWGDGTSGTSTYTDANPPNNTDVVLTVYGRVVAGQDVTAGAYSDTVSAVINF